MEIGVSTASYFNKMQTEDAVTDIAAHGVPLCEIFLNSFCEYQPSFIQLLKSRLENTPLSVYSVHPMGTQFEPQLFSLHSRQRDDAWKLYEQVLQGAQAIGAGHYVMHGPASMSGAARHIGLERVSPIFCDLADMARGYGVQLTLENVSWCIYRDPDFAARLVDRIGTEKLKFTLDVKQAIRAGHRPEAFIDAVGGQMVNLHLCDAVTQEDGAFQLAMPGAGNVDFASIRDRLREKGYAGPAFMEVYSDMFQDMSDLYESRERMTALFNA